MIRWRLAALVGAALLLPASAQADSGAGAYPKTRDDVIWSFGSLDRLGGEAIRFSSSPALGGRGVVIELAERPDGGADGNVKFLLGHGRYGWKAGGKNPIGLGARRWRMLLADVDAALARPEPGNRQPNGDIVVCTDGPGYLTERRSAGRSRWLSGFCGDHPNRIVAEIMNALLKDDFASF